MTYNEENFEEIVEIGIKNILESIKSERKIILIKYKNTPKLNKFVEELKEKLKIYSRKNHIIDFMENEELKKKKILIMENTI